MGRKKETSKAVDALLYGVAVGSVTGVMLASPNAVEILEKPLAKIFDKLDERQRVRELSKLRSYLKTQGLVRGDYEHGIELTKKGHKRVRKYEFNDLEIEAPPKWDGNWRIVIFDIPETNRESRVAFTRKIQSLGFQLLQQSVWIHPFECKAEIYFVSSYYEVDEWVTYIKTAHIDNEKALIKRFSKLLKNV